MKTLKSVALAGVLTMVGAAQTPAQNLIVNGDFTASAAAFTTYPGYCLPNGNTNITGWVTTVPLRF